MTPDVRQLRYFIAVAEELNMTRAAKRVFLSQPALSQQIQRMEVDLGVRLLERDHKGVMLTGPGKVMLQHARKTLGEHKRLIQAVRQAGGLCEDRLRIAYRETMDLPFIASTIQATRQRFTNLKVERFELSPEEQQTAVLEHRLDISILALEKTMSQDLEHLPLLKTHWVIGLPKGHPLAEFPQISLSQLSGQALITVSQSLNTELFSWFLECCETAGFQADITFEVGHSFSAINLVEEGLGGFVACSSTALTAHPSIVVRPLVGFDSASTISAIWHRDNNSRIVQSFLEVLKAKL
jgi:DNA-binding transcriptional LysR family regulator